MRSQLSPKQRGRQFRLIIIRSKKKKKGFVYLSIFVVLLIYRRTSSRIHKSNGEARTCGTGERRAKEKRRGQTKRRFYDELACVNERIELLPRLRFDLSSSSSCDETSSPSASTGRRAGTVGPIYDNESGDLSPASRYDEILSEPAQN